MDTVTKEAVNAISNTVAVEDVVNDSLVEIVDSIETRLIQEEIKKAVDKNGEAYYAYASTLGGIGYTVVALLIGVIPFIFGYEMIYVSSAIMPGILLMTLPATLITAPMMIAHLTWVSKQNKHYYNVVGLRKKLLEKSLKAEIVSGANALNEKWSEVSTIQGGKAAKYLVRIVKDTDTELEKVDVRKFEN